MIKLRNIILSHSFAVCVFLLACCFLQPCHQSVFAHTLCRNKSPLYDVVISRDASTSERTAAKELIEHLNKISGATFSFTAEKGSLLNSAVPYHIYIGFDSSNPIFEGRVQFADTDESFVYCLAGKDLIIYGGRDRGTLYGVYSFLEQQLGIRWYTTDFTHIPHADTIELPNNLDVIQHPAFSYRFDYCYESLRDDVWCARNRMNMQQNVVKNNYGNMTGYWGAHTFQKLLPPNEYFSTHPEYFSLYKGKRIDNGQLCLSNPTVLRLVTERLGRYIKANPDCWGYDVSQNDNKLYCQCKNCKKIAKKYGGQSGLMLWFVNQVAKEIGKSYPSKLIGTFAYEYTRRPPRGIKPLQNVVIRLCDIECCFLHPLDKCSSNKSFLADLKAWKSLTDKIYVWDYIVNFHYYHLPFPNHGVLAENLRLFRDNNIMGVLELGAYDARWSDFSEMRQWITAKLLWNPELNTDSLAQTFIKDYYGDAAPNIQKYYELIGTLPHKNVHNNCHADPVGKLYTREFRQQSLELLRSAEQTAQSGKERDKILPRVKRILAQAYYTRTLLDGAASLTDGTFLRLKQIIDDDPTTMRERGQSINQYLRHHGYI